jgi:hypothetical protein
MLSADPRHIGDAVPSRGGTPAKIHVFKPDWMKIFVKPAQLFPDVAARHEECARGLFDRTFAIQIPIQVSIPPVCGIARPQAVDPQKLERQSCRRREAADSEPGLRAPVWPGKLACGESVFPAGLD